MQGEIVGINPLRSIIVVQTSAGFTVAEVLGGFEPLNLDDLVSGPLDRQEIQTLVNVTQETRMDVFITASGCSDDDAVSLAG